MKQRLFVLSSILGMSACSSSGGPAPENMGVAQVAITSVPSDVSCIRLSLNSSGAIVQRSFDVAHGASTILSVPDLPTGSMTFSADAFGSACSAVGSSSVGSWISNKQTVTLAAGVPSFVTLTMERNGEACVAVDFPVDGFSSDAGTSAPTGPTATITGGPSGTVTATTASFTFTGSTTDAIFQCSLDGAAWTTCVSPINYPTIAAGAHTFAVRAMTPTCVPGATATRAWTVSASTSDAGVDAVPLDVAGDPCDLPNICPTPATGNMQVCGSVFDLETTGHLLNAGAAVEVAVYDPILFMMSTPTTRPAPIGKIAVDACGRFSSASGAAIPRGTSSNYILAVDDKTGATANDYVTTAIFVWPKSDMVIGARAFAYRSTTDTAWSTAAAATPTFGTRGSLMGIFIDPNKAPVGPFPGAPVAGVQITNNGAVNAARDAYFSDSSALQRSTVSNAAVSTGPNGSAIFMDPVSPSPVSGTGGMAAGCSGWAGPTLGATAGVMLVQEILMKCP